MALLGAVCEGSYSSSKEHGVVQTGTHPDGTHNDMIGTPAGGISMIINLTIMSGRSVTRRIFPSNTPRAIKTRNMPLISLAILISITSVVLICAMIILQQGFISMNSNARLAEDMMQHKPLIPCMLMQKTCQ